MRLTRLKPWRRVDPCATFLNMEAANTIKPRPLHLKAKALGKKLQRLHPFLNEAEALTRALVHLAGVRKQR